MYKKWLSFPAIACLALLLHTYQASASPVQPTAQKAEEMEGALLQLLHNNIYASLQSVLGVSYPQFRQESITRIVSYETGMKPHLPVDAVGGAHVYEIDVEVRMSSGQAVLLTLNNESGSYRLVKHRMLR